MPSVILANDSTVLTGKGWVSIGAVGRSGSLVGVDRHGKLAVRTVALTASKNSARVAVVGTEATCGIFAPETRLLLKDGTAETVGAIVETLQPGGHWFENVVTVPSSNLTGDLFFRALSKSAAFSTDRGVALRCRSRNVQEWESASRSAGCRYTKVSEEAFCLIGSTRLKRLHGLELIRAIRDVSDAVWRSPEDEAREFDYSSLACCLWYVTALSALKVGYVLMYDSLQHSLLFRVVLDSSHKPPVKKCRCAFYQSETTASVNVTWESSSWTPIGSGFLISGR